MFHWIAHLVGTLRYVGVALLMAIEDVVFPIPSELIMPFAGFLAARGRMTLWGVITAGTIGSVLGALPGYILARAYGEERMTQWIQRHGRWLFLKGDELRNADQRFQRRGGWAVFISQIVPGVRALIVLPAGFARMNVALFLFAEFAGTLIWCAVLAILGNLLGVHFRRIQEYMRPVSWTVIGILIVAGVIWFIRRRYARRAAV